jgi:hypothetical protein
LAAGCANYRRLKYCSNCGLSQLWLIGFDVRNIHVHEALSWGQLTTMLEELMKKIALTIITAAAVCAAVPASAQTVVIRDGLHRSHGMYHRDRAYRAHAEWRHRDHGWRGHGRGPAIVIRP